MSARGLQVLASLGAVDTTAPTITSSNSVSNAENSTLSHSLTANETVTWSIVGGADQTKFEISGSTLRWASNGTKDFEAPDDANTDNAYVVDVRATDLASNTTDQTITVTVTDAAEWSTAFSDALNLDSTGWSGYNMRQVLDASQITGSGSNIRLTLESASGAGFSIDALYVGHQAGAGDAYDMDGSQVQLLVSGSGTISLGAGATVVTDPAAFAYDETKAIIISCHFNASSDVRGRNASGAGTNFFKNAASEAGTSDVSGYAATNNANRLVNKIEVS